MESIILIVIIVAFGLMMWWQSKKAKQQRDQLQDFRSTLEPGTEVITIGGVIGKVVSVDSKYEEIVIDSEGSQLRFKFSAINKAYTRPAFIDDDTVDENGDPLPVGEDANDGEDANTDVDTDDAQKSYDEPDAESDATTTGTQTETTVSGDGAEESEAGTSAR